MTVSLSCTSDGLQPTIRCLSIIDLFDAGVNSIALMLHSFYMMNYILKKIRQKYSRNVFPINKIPKNKLKITEFAIILYFSNSLLCPFHISLVSNWTIPELTAASVLDWSLVHTTSRLDTDCKIVKQKISLIGLGLMLMIYDSNLMVSYQLWLS